MPFDSVGRAKERQKNKGARRIEGIVDYPMKLPTHPPPQIVFKHQGGGGRDAKRYTFLCHNKYYMFMLIMLQNIAKIKLYS